MSIFTAHTDRLHENGREKGKKRKCNRAKKEESEANRTQPAMERLQVANIMASN